MALPSFIPACTRFTGFSSVQRPLGQSVGSIGNPRLCLGTHWSPTSSSNWLSFGASPKSECRLEPKWEHGSCWSLSCNASVCCLLPAKSDYLYRYRFCWGFRFLSFNAGLPKVGTVCRIRFQIFSGLSTFFSAWAVRGGCLRDELARRKPETIRVRIKWMAFASETTIGAIWRVVSSIR